MAFKLAKEVYALSILKVQEIIGLKEITRVPSAQEFIRGVINLRGKVIPVIDLRLKFGLEQVEATDLTVIIVVQYTQNEHDLTMGILVDEVLEVLDIQPANIQPPPSFGAVDLNSDFILGVGMAEKRVIFLLDIDKALTSDDRDEVSNIAGS